MQIGPTGTLADLGLPAASAVLLASKFAQAVLPTGEAECCGSPLVREGRKAIVASISWSSPIPVNRPHQKVNPEIAINLTTWAALGALDVPGPLPHSAPHTGRRSIPRRSLREFGDRRGYDGPVSIISRRRVSCSDRAPIIQMSEAAHPHQIPVSRQSLPLALLVKVPRNLASSQ